MKLNERFDEDILRTRLATAKSARRYFEDVWLMCLDAAYKSQAASLPLIFRDIGVIPQDIVGTGIFNFDDASHKEVSNIYVNYIQKDLRFLHSQLSLNPPVVVPQPTSHDLKDRAAAQAAHNVIKYCVRRYNLNEYKDLACLYMLLTGTGVLKIFWDHTLGEPIFYNQETNELETEGDINIVVVPTWFVYPDPTSGLDPRWVFERVEMKASEVEYFFGDRASSFIAGHEPDDVVTIYEYHEAGHASNKYLGRHCWCLEDGSLLSDVEPAIYGHIKQLKDGSTFKIGALPYHWITDVDVPNSLFGIPTILFAAEVQRELNNIDKIIFTSVRAHGCGRIVLSNDTRLADDSVTNNPYDVLVYDGEIPPVVQAPTPVSPAVVNIRQLLSNIIPDITGINESMYGKIGRETAAAALQYASSQGMNLRARVFNKYVRFVEGIYTALLEIIKENWTLPRLIRVEGQEDAYTTIQFSSSDIIGGYEFQAQYGTDFSLDPQIRRQEILQLLPILKELGAKPEQIAQLFRLSDISGILYSINKPANRMREIIEKMIAKREYIAPEELQDHKGMLVYAYDYVMSAEFFSLDKEVQELIKRHIKEREKLMQQEQPATDAPTDNVANETEMPPAQNLLDLLGG